MKITQTVSNRIAPLVVVLAVIAGIACVGAAPEALGQSTSGFTYNGMDYISYGATEYLETPQGPDGTAALRAAGANYTAVMATWYVQTYDSTTIAPETTSTPGYDSSTDPLSPTDAAVVAAIQNLQAQGITVTLKPHVDSLDGIWRGQFTWPSTDTTTAEQQAWLTAWFTSYESFILHFAQIATENNVGIMVIGTEFKDLSGSNCAGSCENYWLQYVINPLRQQYPNLMLAYGANATGAGDEFTSVTFWPDVDIIGVDGYFPLTNHADPTVAQLVAAWTTSAGNVNNFNPEQALKNLQSTYPSKPLIFSELGYTSTAGTNEAPYNYSPTGAYDPTEQEDCYEAFFEVFSLDTSWMKGVFWWDWSVSAPSANDTGYSPQNKPAGDTTLPKWYGSTTEGFTLAASNSMLSLGQGLNSSETISVTNLGGFTGAVTLSATGLPSGVTAVFATNPTTGASALTLTASSTAAIGAAPVTITGTSGTLTASTTIALTVQAPVAQTIAFANPGAQAEGTQLTLTATASSGLAVSFASSTTGVCTVNNAAGTASLLTIGTCTITASQAGNGVYAAATPVAVSFAVTSLPPVPVPADADVIVSQVNWLAALKGYVQTSNNSTGGSFAVNAYGAIAVADTDNLYLINAQTGVKTTLGAWSGASAVAIDSQNNIYVGSLYGSPESIVKVPYNSATSTYAAFATPTTSTPACTSTSTTECSVSHAGSVYPDAMAFDSAGDLFWITSSDGASGGNGIWECTAACLGGAGSPVQLYQEPTASPAPSPSSGQLIAGGLAIDSAGNVFFTDSSTYVNTTTYVYTSFYSNLNELPTSTGAGYSGKTTGYSASPSVLYTITPATIGTYDNQVDAVAVARNAISGDTVYFADQSDGVFAFPDTSGGIPIAGGQPTALYMVSTQGAKTLTLDSTGNLYLAASSTAINSSGADTVAQLTVDNLTVPASPGGTAVSPSATLNPVTTILNDTACTGSPAPSVNFAGTSTTATATVSTTGTCSSTFSGGGAFTTTVSFTPTDVGIDSISMTATDQANNTGTVTITGVGQPGTTVQTITFANPGAQTVGTPLTLSASSDSGLTVSFASTTTGVCTVSGATATFLTAGTCTIQATQAGDSTYAAATPVSQSFTVNPAPTAQTITFANPGAQNVGTPLTLSATASSGLAVSYASTTASVCTVSGTTATFLTAGTCTIQATQAGDSAYEAATMVSQSFAVNAALTAQTITFANPGAQTVGTPLTLSASSTSGLAVSFASTTASVCTVSGTTATFLTVGTCTIQATQAGNATYAAATMVSQSFTVNGEAQSITFTNPGTQTVGKPLTLSATATSGLAVSYASTTASVCTVSGTTATFLTAGTCTIQATQAGNTTYAPATMVSQSFTVNAALTAQTITFANPGIQTVGTPLTLSATATSGLAVSFASTTASVCTVSGTTATFLTAGTCTIQATQAGNATYAAATMVSQSFTVNAALTAQTITFANPGAQTVGTPLPLSASSTSGLAVSFASTTASVCTVSGATATFLTVGTCTIQATQAGNATYAAAAMVSQSFAVNAAPIPGFTLSASPASLTVAQGSGGSSTITVAPTNGFTGNVTLTAEVMPPSGAQSLPVASFGSTSPVSITSSTAGTATLTITTTPATMAALVHPKQGGLPWYSAGGAFLACILFFGIPARRRSWQKLLGMLLFLAAITGGMAACGGSSSSSSNGGTTPGAYTVIVNASSGATTSAPIQINLTVQ